MKTFFKLSVGFFNSLEIAYQTTSQNQDMALTEYSQTQLN